jgi:AcrR family transcriptional regulator
MLRRGSPVVKEILSGYHLGMRADAARTHARIVEVATEQFGNHGTETSLNEIAKRVGIGPGTLYRHFPSRESLIDACMANWEAQLLAAAERAAASDDTTEHLMARWADEFTRHISVFRGGPSRLLRALGNDESLWIRRWDILEKATQCVLDRAASLNTPVALDARRVCIMMCGVAATAEEARLGHDERCDLLRVLAHGLLSSPATPPHRT